MYTSLDSSKVTLESLRKLKFEKKTLPHMPHGTGISTYMNGGFLWLNVGKYSINGASGYLRWQTKSCSKHIQTFRISMDLFGW